MAEQKKQEQQAKGMSVREAGQKGGNATKHKYGPEFYEEIGQKGGNSTKEKHGPDFYAEIGRQGGKK